MSQPPPPWLLALRKLIQRLEESGVAELEIAAGDLAIYVRRRQPPGPAPDAPQAPGPEQAAAGAPQAAAAASLEAGGGAAEAPPAGEDAGLEAVTSPLTGVYYATPSPHAPPFVSEGDFVEEGQVVALVEAMKVFNEVRAERAGRVVRIVATPGQEVQAGDALLLLAPEEAPEARALV